jgi:AcrR family transcriptional regulator
MFMGRVAGFPMLTTAQRRDRLRQRLIEATERLVAAGGLEAVKARELAREVDCSVGMIYQVFADLDDLLLVVNARTLEALDAVMSRAGGGAGGDPRARLQALGKAYLDFALAENRRWRALFEHRLPAGRAVPDWYTERLEALFRHLREPLAALLPGLSPPALADVANALFSGTHGVVILGLDGKLGRVPPEVIAGRVRFLIDAALVGAPSAACLP